MRHLERLPYSGAVGRAIFEAFRRAEPSRRTRLLMLMARTGDHRFVDLLVKHLEENAGQTSSPEAMEIGRAIGLIGGAPELPRWSAWLKPTGLFRKALPGPVARQVAAAAALAELPGDDAAQVLRAALVIAGPEAHDWIGRSLAHQRNAGRRGVG
jgi:hypothetical protein